MYLDKSGKKISKSAGNVFTPQVWFRYGSPQSLLLLTLKRFVGTRSLSVTDIPQYMNELDDLEDIYFGKKVLSDRKEKAKLVGLFRYCMLFNLPTKISDHVPYNLLTFLAKMAPEGSETEFILEKLQAYGYGKDGLSENMKRRIDYALNWSKDFTEINEQTIDLSKQEQLAISELILLLNAKATEEEIQTAIFDVAKNNNIKPGKFFKTLYRILLGTPQGPRLGSYVLAMGRENVTYALKRAAKL
jgi:lysyl-tRNA synthetase class 1